MVSFRKSKAGNFSIRPVLLPALIISEKGRGKGVDKAWCTTYSYRPMPLDWLLAITQLTDTQKRAIPEPRPVRNLPVKSTVRNAALLPVI